MDKRGIVSSFVLFYFVVVFFAFLSAGDERVNQNRNMKSPVKPRNEWGRSGTNEKSNESKSPKESDDKKRYPKDEAPAIIQVDLTDSEDAGMVDLEQIGKHRIIASPVPDDEPEEFDDGEDFDEDDGFYDEFEDDDDDDFDDDDGFFDEFEEEDDDEEEDMDFELKELENVVFTEHGLSTKNDAQSNTPSKESNSNKIEKALSSDSTGNTESVNENAEEAQRPLSKEDIDLLMKKGLEEAEKQNYERAIAVFTQVGKENVADAWTEAGKIRLFHPRNESDLLMANEYFQMSAQLGNPASQFYIAILQSILKPDSTKNIPMALLNYFFAARGGDTDAITALGLRYLHGENVQQSCAQALELYSAVAKKLLPEVKPVGYLLKHNDQSRITEINDNLKQSSNILMQVKHMVDHGDAQGLMNTGNINLHGLLGTKQNFTKALEYFKKASLNNNPEAWGQIGIVYLNGYGVEIDNQKAFDAFTKGAEMNHHLSHNGLGYMYLHGLHVEQNKQTAYQHFKKAEESGSVEGHVNIGLMHLEGRGANPDQLKTFLHFTIAAHAKYPLAYYYLAYMHEKGWGAPAECSTATNYYKKFVDDVTAYKYLKLAAAKYRKGDYFAALVLNEIGSELGYEVAQSNSAYLYENKLGYHKSDHMELAFKRYKQSANHGISKSLIKVGDGYYYGHGVQQDYESAFHYYSKAARSGSAQALFNIGYMHQYAIGAPKDLNMAKTYYNNAITISKDALIPSRLALYVLEAQLLWGYYAPLAQSYYTEASEWLLSVYVTNPTECHIVLTLSFIFVISIGIFVLRWYRGRIGPNQL